MREYGPSSATTSTVATVVAAVQSTGEVYNLGLAGTVNRAHGSGPWEGDFYTVMGSFGYVTGGGFLTPAGAMPAFDEPGYGWDGVQAGGTWGLPAGVGANLSRFTKVRSIDFPCN